MIFESLSSQKERRIRIWHRRYALFPKTIGKTTVWLDYYWRRFVDVEADSIQDLQYAFTCAILGRRMGYWEHSVFEPVKRGTIIPFKRVS